MRFPNRQFGGVEDARVGVVTIRITVGGDIDRWQEVGGWWWG